MQKIFCNVCDIITELLFRGVKIGVNYIYSIKEKFFENSGKNANFFPFKGLNVQNAKSMLKKED